MGRKYCEELGCFYGDNERTYGGVLVNLNEMPLRAVFHAANGGWEEFVAEQNGEKELREACLHNDIGRRTKSARITIQNEKYETPDCEYISKETGLSCKLQKHIVVRKSNYDMFCDVNNIVNKEQLLSDSWSLGGTFGNCWNDKLGTLSPESPKPFKEFDELLERICPNLTFLQYKKLERECTEIAEYEESDYYGGTEYRSYHKCDLRKLYNLLNEMGYINLEEQIETDLSEERDLYE